MSLIIKHELNKQASCPNHKDELIATPYLQHAVLVKLYVPVFVTSPFTLTSPHTFNYSLLVFIGTVTSEDRHVTIIMLTQVLSPSNSDFVCKGQVSLCVWLKGGLT